MNIYLKKQQSHSLIDTTITILDIIIYYTHPKNGEISQLVVNFHMFTIFPTNLPYFYPQFSSWLCFSMATMASPLRTPGAQVYGAALVSLVGVSWQPAVQLVEDRKNLEENVVWWIYLA